MSVGDIYQVRMFQELSDYSDELLNVYFYRQTAGFSGVPNAADMIGEFLDNVWDTVRACQNSVLVTRKYTCVNINDPTDYVEGFPSSPGGITAGNLVPAFIVMTIRSARAAMGDRYTYKRFSGVQTGHFASDATFTSTILDLLDATATAHGSILEGANGTYEPVQVAAGWTLGAAPTVRQSLAGLWSYNRYASHQSTRQDDYYDWVGV